MYIAISRKVAGQRPRTTNVHATIPKGGMGYDQYTVPDTVAVEPKFCCFPQVLVNIRPWSLEPLFQVSLKTVNLKPPTIAFGIVACFFPTIFLEVALRMTCGRYMNLSRLTFKIMHLSKI